MSRQSGFSSRPSSGSVPSPLQSPAAERTFQLQAVNPDRRARLPAVQQQQQLPQEQLPPVQAPGQSPRSSDDGTVKSRKSSHASLAGGYRTAAAAEAAASTAAKSTTPIDVDPKSKGTQRSVGVESMLNPQRQLNPSAGRRRSAVEMHRSSPIARPALPSLQRTSSTGSQRAAHLPDPSPTSTMPPRRTLTPRSPSRRAASLSGMSPTGTIDARQSPFLLSQPRKYTVEPGVAGAPPLPTQSRPPPPPEISTVATAPVPPTGSRSGDGFPFPATATPPLPMVAGARRSTIAAIAPIRGPQSESVSPTTSTASYTHPEQISPAQRLPALTAITGSMPVPFAGSASAIGPVGLDFERGYPHPMTSAASTSADVGPGGNGGGQGNYRMLTLSTQQGPVQLPVDVQAASRHADEKRKRNAGASARFRQRRKEKEREATSTIQRLEQQLRDASEDVDFYRNERDLVVSVLMQHFPNGPAERLFPRPPSPRHSRRQRVQRDQQEQRREQEQRQRRADEEAEELEALRAAQRLNQASNMASAPASAPASAGPYLVRFFDQKADTEDERTTQYHQQQFSRLGASAHRSTLHTGLIQPSGQTAAYAPLPPGIGSAHTSYASIPPYSSPIYPASGMVAIDATRALQHTGAEAGANRATASNVAMPSRRLSMTLPPVHPPSPLPSAQPQVQYQYQNPNPVSTSLPPMVAQSASSSFSSTAEPLPPLPPLSTSTATSMKPKSEDGWPPGTAR